VKKTSFVIATCKHKYTFNVTYLVSKCIDLFGGIRTVSRVQCLNLKNPATIQTRQKQIMNFRRRNMSSYGINVTCVHLC